MERLQKIIASSGITSRRKAEKLIIDGKVKVNGKIVKDLGTKVSAEDEIEVNNKPINKEEKEYFLLYKPEKTVSTVDDEKGRKTVVDLISTKKRIYPVGRLDYDTSGLLLLTNDGELANILMHPKNDIEKVYLAKIDGVLSPKELMKIKKNLVVEDRKVEVTLIKTKSVNKEEKSSNILIGIVEGRNHIVKKIFGEVNHKVLKLKRESFGFLNLEGLKKGEYRKLSIKEVKKLYSLKNSRF